MNMPLTRTADEDRIAELEAYNATRTDELAASVKQAVTLEAKLAARDEALKVAKDVLSELMQNSPEAGYLLGANEALTKIEELLK